LRLELSAILHLLSLESLLSVAEPLLINKDHSDVVRAIDIADSPAERRSVPRTPFRATSVVTEIESSRIAVAHTREVSRFGCFVQTVKPCAKGTKVRIEIADGLEVFTTFGVVVYVTPDGMGIAFDEVESENRGLLERWLSRKPRRSHRYSFGVPAEVKDLTSNRKQVLLTHDLSAGGCFVKTLHPLPKGSRIRLRIRHAGARFTAMATVTDDRSEEGMGVEFTGLKPKDRAILEKWLAGETLVNDTLTYFVAYGLFFLLLAAAVVVAIFLVISPR
jgi:hypothetical protein